MYRQILVPILAFALLLATAMPASAGVTATLHIKWIKAHPTGVLFSLDRFTLADVDPTDCADPGSPYFWIPAGSANAEALIAVLLTADASDKPVKIRYTGCGAYSPSTSMLDVWMLHVN